MKEFLDYRDRMNIPQRVVAIRLEKLWNSVEEARQKSYPNIHEEDLPKSYQQRYLAIRYRIQEILIEMVSKPSYLPEETTVLNDIRERILRFLKENDSRES